MKFGVNHKKLIINDCFTSLEKMLSEVIFFNGAYSRPIV